MKIAFTYWENRIAPVFDIARQIHVVESEGGRIVGESEEILEDGLPLRKAINLAQLGIATLVCGAISRPLHEMVMSNGIRVIPFVAGDLGEVIQAWLGGKLDNDSFAMPGCCGRGGGGLRKPCCTNGEVDHMNQGNGGGQGRGQGRGRMGGPQAGAGTGFCICTKCGHREPHQRAVPCVQKQCPKCGTALTRE
jgi:predicted Fe-Mo cluster-binding NifX family protein